MKKGKGKRHANRLAMNREAGYKSNRSGMPKGPTRTGTNLGHVPCSKTTGTTRFKG